MESFPEEIKIGSANVGEHIAEIRHETPDGVQVRVSGLYRESEDAEALSATMYTFDPASGDTSVNYGRVRGAIREASQYVWEHKKQAATTVGSVAVSVVLGTLWVRHKRKG